MTRPTCGTIACPNGRPVQKDAGFTEPSVAQWRLPMEFRSWIARIGAPPARVAALEAVFATLPKEARDYFQVSGDLSFIIDSAWMETTKRDA